VSPGKESSVCFCKKLVNELTYQNSCKKQSAAKKSLEVQAKEIDEHLSRSEVL
jgi:hypothetical protein